MSSPQITWDQPQQQIKWDEPAQPSAGSRFLEGMKAGTGGDNTNTMPPPDPNRNYLRHPDFANNALLPGSGVYRDIKAGNLAGAAGRIVGPAAEMIPMLMGGKGEIGEPAPSRPSALGVKARAVGGVLAKEGISHIPIAGRIVQRPSIGDYISALRARPEVAPTEIGTGSTDQMPGRPYQPNPRFQPSPTAQPIPSRSGLMLKGEIARTPTPSDVEGQLNKALGGKPLTPNVSLRNQNRISPEITSSPSKSAASSAIMSYRYNPDKQEMEVMTKAGQQYIHGDVSPEQAETFENASSKGKAWGELKKNSTYVGKIVNGQRINAKPPSSLRSASPDDLTPILQESLKQAISKKK